MECTMTPDQRRRLAAVDRETDEMVDRLKWARMATEARRRGIGDIAAPPGGWPAAMPAVKYETPPVRSRVDVAPVRYKSEEPRKTAPRPVPPAASAAAKPAVKPKARRRVNAAAVIEKVLQATSRARALRAQARAKLGR